MQAFLRKANVQMDSNEPFDAWLEEVRKVARNVEDIIDEYVYLIEQTEDTSSSVKKTFHYIKNFSSWHEINSQLKRVKDQLSHLTEMRERYGITISEVGRSINNPPKMYSGLDLSTTIVEDEVVGNASERVELMQWLLEKNLGRAIISIFGMGGLGKTTLVATIYKKKEIEKNFDCYAFVSVSQNFQVEDLLRSIIKQIHEREEKIPTEIDHMGPGDLVDRLQCYMQNKSYLVVLDDMWKRDAWSFLSHAFPVNNSRGRVVITTRIKDVALLADENRVMELRALSKEESWDLFCRKAFGRLKEKICPPHLADWAKKILDKCQGLPLAIIAIGSLLSFRERSEREWRIFYDQLSWEISNSSDELGRVADLLNLSYNNLPTHLKNCFLYCSLFPEDYLIKRKLIIRLWIAEGFIAERGMETTLEEVAERYLVELIHRSLLQVVEKSVNGRVRKFRVHDLIRDICIARSKKELFGIICHNRWADINEKPCRLFVQNQHENLQIDGGSSKLRSFLLFNNQLPSWQIENVLLNFKLMRVLCLKYSRIENLPDVVFELFNLHYLDLSYTRIKVISKSLGNLKLLQTLDLRGTLVEHLPREITKLTNLRHLLVILYLDYQSRIFDWFSGVSVPVGICGLKDVQTLCGIEASNELVSHFGSLARLTNIILLKVQGSHISGLWYSFSKMPRLNRLCIIACDKDEVLNFENLNPILFHLEKLYLQGKLEGGVIPSIFNSFGNIIGLRMGWSGLRVDPLSSFSHMSNLADLHLNKVYEGQVLTFCSGWFPKLKNLDLVDLLYLTRINFEQGTTKSLHCLWLVGLRSLTKVPKGIRHLCSLQNMEIEDMPMEFIQSLRGEDHNIVRHIQHINVYE